MAAPRHETVNDLQELLALAKAVGIASATNLLWFRGVSDATHTLLPGLYRGGDPANVLVAKENLMRSQFASRSMPLLEGTQQNEWGFLFIMQHYGAPTRLLDGPRMRFSACTSRSLLLRAKGSQPTRLFGYSTRPLGTPECFRGWIRPVPPSTLKTPT